MSGRTRSGNSPSLPAPRKPRLKRRRKSIGLSISFQSPFKSADHTSRTDTIAAAKTSWTAATKRGYATTSPSCVRQITIVAECHLMGGRKGDGDPVQAIPGEEIRVTGGGNG